MYCSIFVTGVEQLFICHKVFQNLTPDKPVGSTLSFFNPHRGADGKNSCYMNDLDSFIQDVLNDYDARLADKSKVIDRVFCFIEQDKKHLKDYLDLLADGNYSLKYVNSHIAQCIAKHYGLESVDSGFTPESKLIQSYSELR